MCFGNVETQKAVLQAGALDPLVKMLGFDHPAEVQEEAVYALKNLASNCNDHRDAVMEAGALPHLLTLISHGTGGPRVGAAGTVRRLVAKRARHERALVQGGGLPACVTLLESDDSAAQEEGAGIFRSIVQRNDPSTERAIMAAGAAQPLIACLRNGTPEVKEQAAGALICLVDRMVELLESEEAENKEAASFAIASLAEMTAENRAAILEEGAVPFLVDIMRQKDPPEPTLQEAAASAVRSIARSTEAHSHLLEAEALPIIKELLHNGSTTEEQIISQTTPAAVAAAAAAAGELALTSVAQKILQEDGVIPLLTKLVASHVTSVFTEAVGALGRFAESNESARKAIMKEKIAERVLEIAASDIFDARVNACVLLKNLALSPMLVATLLGEGAASVLSDIVLDTGNPPKLISAAKDALRTMGVTGNEQADEEES